jgi:DNA replication protein DnaC
VCGPSGTGKSHLLEALGHAAVDAGHHVAWFSLADQRANNGDRRRAHETPSPGI